MDKFAAAKETYAHFEIDKIKGTRGLHGSSMSEQTHSGVLYHLNDGHVKNNEYCENAITLVKELFVRQQRNVVITNKLLFQEDTHMITEIERLIAYGNEQ